jgi:hypothetical protein
MSSCNISVNSHTTHIICHGGFQVDVPEKFLLMIDNKPFIKLIANHHKLIELVTGGGGQCLPDCSFKSHIGLNKLKEWRNKATRADVLLDGDCNSSTRFCFEEGDTTTARDTILASQLPTKRVKKMVIPKRAATADPTVSFEVPGYGIVTAVKGTSMSHCLIIPLEAHVLDVVFHFMVDETNEEHRYDRRMGRYTKRRNPQEKGSTP